MKSDLLKRGIITYRNFRSILYTGFCNDPVHSFYISGLQSQVYLPFKQQVELDKEYIKNRSLWKDFLILLKTIPAVLTGKGAY